MAFYDPLSRYTVSTGGQLAFRDSIKSRNYNIYTVKAGDTLESLATRVLGNPLRYWEIADLNPQVKFPLDISVGTVLRLPL
jgi:nucleoid-associated protein YgaU